MTQDLGQADIRRDFEAQGDGPWTTVHDSTYAGRINIGMYCALASPSRRKEALERLGWLLRKTDGSPGFSQSWEDDAWVATYLPNGSGDSDVEPLVLVREYYGAADTEYEIDQQFRLFHNLRYDSESRTYVKMNEDGTQTLAVRFDGEKIEIRTTLLKRYIAARGMDLLLFIDSKVYSDAPPVRRDAEVHNRERGRRPRLLREPMELLWRVRQQVLRHQDHRARPGHLVRHLAVRGG